jgi:Mg/Co/Ni transporter MgtE
MTTRTRPLAELTYEAISVLLREMGVVDTVRFLNQYTAGYGNYTEEREQLFGHLTLDEIISEIKQERPPTTDD